MNVPRQLMPCIRSNRFIGVSSVPVRLMALALLTSTSMPPNVGRRLFDGRLNLLLEANVGNTGQRLAARFLKLFDRRVHGAFELGMRLGRLGGHDDIRPVAGRPQADGFANAPAGAGNKDGFSFETGHGGAARR